jgi:DNA-binding NtrC family response regulator
VNSTSPFKKSRHLRPLHAAEPVRLLLALDPEAAEPPKGEPGWLEEARGQDWEIQWATDPEQVAQIRQSWEPTFVLCPDREPMLEACRPFGSEVDGTPHPLVILLVDDYSPAAIDAVVEQGADTLLQRPIRFEPLWRLIQQEQRVIAKHGVGESSRISLPVVIGESPAIREISANVSKAAPSDATTLITGESGTGKELVARAIHRLSPRRDRPFVAVNCGAIPENLIESELFGHEKGAFTDATSRRQGRFELADTGTLFLDEVGELHPQMQVKLLRVLQEQRFERVGGTEPISVDVRLIAATNQHITGSGKLESMRSDLFYRLNVLRIEAPPLRERKSDIRLLWNHFVEEAADLEARSELETDADVLPLLLRYQWPGNVRELENVARHAVALSSGGTLTTECLPHYLTLAADQTVGQEFDLVGQSLDTIEREAILQTCEATSSVKEAAELLGVSERKIYYRLKQYRQDEGSQPETSESETPEETEEASEVTKETESIGMRAARTKPVLLLAEDDDDLRWALGSYLAESFDVISVADGDSLIRRARAVHPDIILTDIRMPGRNPMESLRTNVDETPIVFFSGHWNEKRRAQAREAGASAYLDKPLDIENLESVLKEAAEDT